MEEEQSDKMAKTDNVMASTTAQSVVTSSRAEATQKGQPVIQCDSVYKIFGENAKKLLQNASDNVDPKVFQEAGCIVGVNNASFEVYKGQMLVVMGLSGSGKSTLLRCISRLTDTTAGHIFIDGEDLLAMSGKRLIELRRNKMGMVFQSFALLPHKTVLENIAFPLQIKGNGTQDSIKRAMDMVQLVGLGGRENNFPRELSGGQQQRVGIARSLAVEPDIWFLDEPFSALDPLIRKEMQDEFLRLQGVLNKTILFVTHDFDEALRLADRIAIMKDGVIEQLDTPANIVLNPATEYVRRFTEDVPREKVLKIESVMDPIVDSEELSDLRVSKDALIETVAEAVLNEGKPIAVVDANNNVVGAVHSSKIIHVLFGSRAKKDKSADLRS
jgi:glycine betaine/proline transport system ATP-binding protein